MKSDAMYYLTLTNVDAQVKKCLPGLSGWLRISNCALLILSALGNKSALLRKKHRNASKQNLCCVNFSKKSSWVIKKCGKIQVLYVSLIVRKYYF